jgi:hypothetical protein
VCHSTVRDQPPDTLPCSRVVCSRPLLRFLLRKHFIAENFQQKNLGEVPLSSFCFFFTLEIYTLKKVISPPLAHSSPAPSTIHSARSQTLSERTQRERELFIGTQFSNLYTAVDTHTKNHGQKHSARYTS